MRSTICLCATLAITACGDDTAEPAGTSTTSSSASSGSPSSASGPTQPGSGGSGDGGDGQGAAGGGAGTGASGGAGGAGGEALIVTPPPWDWVGVVGTGQSLSVGAVAGASVSTTQPYENKVLFDAGSAPLYDGDGDVLSLIPLTAPVRQGVGGPGGPYPNNIVGETPNEGMANQLSASALELGGFGYTSVHSIVGESGQSITVIEKNGTGKAFAATLYEAHAIKALAEAEGRTFGYGAVVLTHGETDSGDPTYGDQIAQLAADYDADLRAITGQTETIPLIVSQQSAVPSSANGRSLSTIAQWRLGVDHPGLIYCSGPKYQYEYAGDHLHMNAASYRRLGEKYAEVLARVQLLGEAWHPLQPSAASLAGTTITVSFEVPDPPLAWQETIAAPHQSNFTEWAAGRGFEVEDSTGRLAIASVEIVGNDVEIELAAAPSGEGLVVRYAMTQDVENFASGGPGARQGQLRDSDPFVGRDAESIAAVTAAGSTTITAAVAGSFSGRALGDLVTGEGIPDGAVVVARTNDTLTLSAAATASATVDVEVHHDQRNYAVHFELPVP